MTNEEITKIIEEAEWQQEAFLRVSGDLSKRMIKALRQVHKSDSIDHVIETSPKIPVLQDDSIKEKCCNNCKHNGNQMIYPSACTGCGADEEYNNHEYSR